MNADSPSLVPMEVHDMATRFWVDGYLVLENQFPDATMDRLQRRIEAHFGQDPAFAHTSEFLTAAATEVIPWFPQAEGVSDFDELASTGLMEALASAILGDGWYSQYCMIMYSKTGTAGQAWHQDCPPEEPTQFNLNRLVYTMDIDERNGGALELVPGSHRFGELPSSSVEHDFAQRITLAPRKGTLIFLHGHTWHSVRPVGRGGRVSTNYRAAPRQAPADITDVCVYRNMRYRFSTSSIVQMRS